MSLLPGELSTVYRPRPASNDLKLIIEDSLEELYQVWDSRFRDLYGPLHLRIRDLCERFIRCGDPHFGFVRLRCVNPDCPKKDERILPLSCRARGLCPSCGQRRALQWAGRMVDEVLPLVPYRQIVITIPRNLRRPFLYDRSLYADFCRLAYASTRDYLREQAGSFPGRNKAVPVMVVSPQSFGDLIVHNPHIHSVCSLGLFRPDGVFHPMDDVDFSGLEKVFRERFFQMMLRREKVLPETVERMRGWQHSGFSIDFQRKFEEGDRKKLEGLLSYMERAPVSLRRLTYRQKDGMVHYQGTRFHPGLKTDHQLLTPLEFLAMLVPHILLRYEVTIRSYGAISTTFRRKRGWIDHPPVEKPPPVREPCPQDIAGEAPVPNPPLTLLPSQLPPPPGSSSSQEDTNEDDRKSDFIRRRKRGWGMLISQVWHENPELCRCCRQPMKIIAAFKSPEQDDVIERILRHLNLWDPPWLKMRKARAPPPSSMPSRDAPSDAPSPETFDQIIDDDLYSSDPIWDDE